MMKTFFLRLILSTGLFTNLLLQVVPGLYFLSPGEGQVVAGTVEIKGSVPDDKFDYAEVSYAFSESESANWFLIQRIEEPLHDEVLARWDTTTITDGVYRLRLRVVQQNGEVNEIFIEDIKVGNYTHYEEVTPTVENVVVQPQVEITATPTSQPSPEPTAFAENPGSIDQGDIRFSFTSGLILPVLIALALGIYYYFRQAARK